MSDNATFEADQLALSALDVLEELRELGWYVASRRSRRVADISKCCKIKDGLFSRPTLFHTIELHSIYGLFLTTKRFTFVNLVSHFFKCRSRHLDSYVGSDFYVRHALCLFEFCCC